MCKQALLLVGLLLTNLPIASNVLAETLSTPTGNIILTVSGNITNTNNEGQAEFDRDMLEALGMTEYETETHWTENRQLFEGVLGSKILEAVGATGDTLTAVALNDYSTQIPLTDFADYPVLIALKQNGKYMRVRDKGPLWIIYPWEQFPELDTNDTRRKWIWQLKAFAIE